MSRNPQPEKFIADYLDRTARPGGIVLEYGAGVVSYQPWIKGRLVRTDVTAELKEGRERGLEAVCDLANLPFAEGSADLIFGVAVLIYLGDLARAARECARVLKPGGVWTMFEYNRLINIYNNRLRAQGYAQTLGLRRLGRALERAGLEWTHRRDIGPDGSKGRWPDWAARKRWVVVEARKRAAG